MSIEKIGLIAATLAATGVAVLTASAASASGGALSWDTPPAGDGVVSESNGFGWGAPAAGGTAVAESNGFGWG